MAKSSRKPAEAPKRHRTTVTIDHDLHVRLATLAALRNVDRNTLIGEILRDALKGVVGYERPGRVETTPPLPEGPP